MRRRPALLIWILAVGLWILSGSVAIAQQESREPVAAGDSTATADSDSTAMAAAEDDRSWLVRALHRYFGKTSSSGDDLQGKAVETVDQFAAHAGKPIEVVIVHQVFSFDDGWDQDKDVSQRTLNTLTDPLHSYTHEAVIRNFLLFKQGDILDPYDLADSERLLRDQRFISDARIRIITLAGEIESVAVVVETKDRWPFGANAKLKAVGNYSFKLFTVNLGGTGLFFENEFIYKQNTHKPWGYRGQLRKDNIRGTFLDLEVNYEDSYRKRTRGASIERSLAHPKIKLVGGVAWERTDDFETIGIPRKWDLVDLWLGHAFRLYKDDRSLNGTARPLLIPAVRLAHWDYLNRPEATADSNRGYHDRNLLLGGLTFQSFKYYKTSYLLKDGETEDFPSGVMLKFSTGYEDREFQKRTPVFFESFVTSLRNRGDVFYFGFDVGGYFRNQRFEEGMLKLGTAYYTQLFGGDTTQWRIYSQFRYTLGLNRYPKQYLGLGDEAGIRGLADGFVLGNQRFVGNLAMRLFSPWYLLGFRLELFGFTDIGVIGSSKAALFKEKIYSSTGLGMRLNNPDLALSTVQIRVSLLQNVDNRGMEVRFKIGNVSYPHIDLLSPKPDALGYK